MWEWFQWDTQSDKLTTQTSDVSRKFSLMSMKMLLLEMNYKPSVYLNVV